MKQVNQTSRLFELDYIKEYLQTLKEWPDRSKCPGIINDVLLACLNSDSQEIVSIGKMYYGNSIEDLSPSSNTWVKGCAFDSLPFLPMLAKAYYFAAIVEQSLTLIHPCIDISMILNCFMPPPDNKKKNRLVLYARTMTVFTPTQLLAYVRYIDLIRKHPSDFVADHELAAKSWDRYWHNYDQLKDGFYWQ